MDTVKKSINKLFCSQTRISWRRLAVFTCSCALLYIDKIDVFKPSPYLDFGTQVHEGCESYLNTKTIPREKLLENIRNGFLKMIEID